MLPIDAGRVLLGSAEGTSRLAVDRSPVRMECVRRRELRLGRSGLSTKYERVGFKHGV